MSTEVYALHYGDFDYSCALVFTRPPLQEQVEMGLYAFLVREEGETTLIDTGFEDGELARRWGVRGYVPVRDLVARLGVNVDNLLLSHGHWDHVGSIGDFAPRRCWIAGAELEAMHKVLGAGKEEAAGYLRRDLDTILRQPGLETFALSAQLTPAIQARVVGGHTPGSLALIVADQLVLASDNACFYANLERGNPLPPRGRHGPDALPQIREIAGRRPIVPGHEPRLMQRYPELLPGIVRLWP